MVVSGLTYRYRLASLVSTLELIQRWCPSTASGNTFILLSVEHLPNLNFTNICYIDTLSLSANNGNTRDIVPSERHTSQGQPGVG